MKPQAINLSVSELRQWIGEQALELGFTELRVADLDLSQASARLKEWLAQGFHGDMNYMSQHADLRSHPEILQPGAVRALCVRMDYLPSNYLQKFTDTKSSHWTDHEYQRLSNSDEAVISLYARGRDYHKVMRSRLQNLSERITHKIGPFGYRAFVDSAPVMEVELASKSGIGWRGKHTLALNREGGSMFFLGEILVDLPLPIDQQVNSNCGTCQACIDICPTKAIIGPYKLDARRCISYLTIEHQGVIPEEFRKPIGNRIYGCDDCQLVCPWNKFAQASKVNDFDERHELGSAQLLVLFKWTQEEFMNRFEGSPIRRIGYGRWLRNLSIALGNQLADPKISSESRQQIQHALQQRLAELNQQHDSENWSIDRSVLIEHFEWALNQSLN